MPKANLMTEPPVPVVRPVRVEKSEVDPVSALIARLMDSAFVIPGTNIRFGFDALIGLFPGVGDSIGALISSVLIAQGARMGVPKIVLTRMAVNVFVNTVVGTVPIFGDIFSIYFRSNVKNYALLQKHANQRHISTGRDWVFVVLLLAATLAVVGGLAFGLFELIAHLSQVPR
jgi:hypothetical protein